MINNPAPSSTSENIDTARVNRLFTRMSAIYGHIWQSQFKEVGFLEFAQKEWGEVLMGIENKNIHLAINECRKRFEYPPTLPVFYQLCRNFEMGNRVVKIEPIATARSTPAVAKAYIQKIREILSTPKSV